MAGEVHEAIAGFETIARQHRRDLVAIKLGQYLGFNLGDAPTMPRLALHAQPAAADVAAARRALTLQPGEPWAQHALAHTMLTDGRLGEGTTVLQQMSGG